MQMEGISDLRIVGFDAERPPMIQPHPCIDLIFELNHEAPPGWCEEFNLLASQRPYSVKIDPETGLFIETWVKKPAEIEKVYTTLKGTVQECITAYINKLNAKANIKVVDGPVKVISPAQQSLNEAVSKMNFEEA